MTGDAIVIVNGGSGGGNDQALVDELARMTAAAGLRARIELAHGDDIARTIAAAIAARPSLIVAGGGDGTISAVAGALVDTGIALGVLPLGTLNHFAKDLGIPLELEAAVRVLAEGRTACIDVGEVNGRVFVNNSSLGLYPEIVRLRERQQKRFGRAKWVAFARAAVATLRRYPFLGVRLTIDGEKALRRTPFVFIGNNEYRMEGFAIGERSGLDDGRLSLYVAQRPGRWRLFLLALRALTGHLREARDFDALLATEIVIESRHHRVRVATDGEVTVMAPPLRYRIRPGCLVVMQPQRDAAS